MRPSASIALALIGSALSMPAVAASRGPAAPGPGGTPAVPAPDRAGPPFAGDRPSGTPVALTPDGVADPVRHPDEAVVRTWGDVPGAVGHQVEISGDPGFSGVLREAEVVQPIAVPEVLPPDGDDWWRALALDQAGTVGMASDLAGLAKTWPSRITDTRPSAVPGGGPVGRAFRNPYMTRSAVPGAAT